MNPWKLDSSLTAFFLILAGFVLICISPFMPCFVLIAVVLIIWGFAIIVINQRAYNSTAGPHPNRPPEYKKTKCPWCKSPNVKWNDALKFYSCQDCKYTFHKGAKPKGNVKMTTDSKQTFTYVAPEKVEPKPGGEYTAEELRRMEEHGSQENGERPARQECGADSER